MDEKTIRPGLPGPTERFGTSVYGKGDLFYRRLQISYLNTVERSIRPGIGSQIEELLKIAVQFF